MPHKRDSSVKEFARSSSQMALVYDDYSKQCLQELDGRLESALRSKQFKPRSTIQKIRKYGRHILHSRPVLIIIVLLCVIDCILVIGELILDIHAIKELKFDWEHGSANSRKEVADNNTSVVLHRAERAASGHSDEAGHHGHPIEEKIAHGFHYGSIAILAVLVFETILKIFFRGRQFVHSSLEVFDAFVVVASFVIDLVFLKGITTLPIQESAYILSFILPWRVIRVVNSLLVAVMDHEHFKLLLVYKSKKHVKHELDDTKEDLDIVRKQLHAAKKLCIASGVAEWKFNQSLLKIATKNNFRKVSAISSLASHSASSIVDENKPLKKTAHLPDLKEVDADKNNGSHMTSEKQDDTSLSLSTGSTKSYLADAENAVVEFEDEGNSSGRSSISEADVLGQNETQDAPESTRL